MTRSHRIISDLIKVFKTSSSSICLFTTADSTADRENRPGVSDEKMSQCSVTEACSPEYSTLVGYTEFWALQFKSAKSSNTSIPVTPALRKMNCEFKATLEYIERSCLKKKTCMSRHILSML